MLEYLKFFSLFATVYACLFWAVALLIKLAVNPRSNIFYVFTLFSTSTVVYLLVIAKYLDLQFIYGTLFPVQTLFVLSLFPLFYLYIHTLTRQDENFKPIYLIHFIIPLTVAAIMFVLLQVQMSESELMLFTKRILYSEDANGRNIELACRVYTFGKILYVAMSIFYTYLIYSNYKAHIKKSNDLFSNEDEAGIKWVSMLIGFYVLLFVFHMLIQVFSNAFLFKHDIIVFLSYIVFSSFFFFLGYVSFTQKQLYFPFADEFEMKKGKNFDVTAEDIKEFMMKEKPYLNKDYSLYDLCVYFNSNRSYLSAIINNDLKMNFRKFINTYRLAEAKLLLHIEVTKDINVSLDYIASKSGFSSYPAFYKVFKEIERITPYEYRDILAKKIKK